MSDLIRYGDKKLFKHQKELFTKIKAPNPKLIFYVAPTGTGKDVITFGDI